jgi:putative transcriptional regulator
VFADEGLIDDYVGELFLGGPVGPDRLLFLLRAPAPDVLESAPVIDDVYVSADPGVLAALVSGPVDPARARIYAGHAAWGPEQLETEIAAGIWRVVPGRAEWVFSEQPLTLWRELARRASGELVVRALAR